MRTQTKLLGLCAVVLIAMAEAKAQTASGLESVLSTTPYGVTSTCANNANGAITATDIPGVIGCNPYITMDTWGTTSVLNIWDTSSGNNSVYLAETPGSGGILLLSDSVGNQNISATSTSTGGTFRVYDDNNNNTINLYGSNGTIVLSDLDGNPNVSLNGSNGSALFANGSATISSGGLIAGHGFNASSQKITAVANGTATTDAAAFGQLGTKQINTVSSPLSFSAGTLSIDGSSLTSVGTLTSLAVSGNGTFGGNIAATGLNGLSMGSFGTQNIAIGGGALPSSGSGSFNVALGVVALSLNTTGGGNTAVGTYAMVGNTTGSNNTAVGIQALNANTTGGGNSGLGTWALINNTTGDNNTATGIGALAANTAGSGNTASGQNALASITTGYANVGIGYFAGQWITGMNQNVTSNNSVYVGAASQAQADGDTNEVVIGSGAVGAGSNSVTLGSTAITKTVLNGNVELAGSGASITFPNGGGTQSVAWNGTTYGGDYAESVDVIGDRKSYEPGDIIAIDPSSPDKFLKAAQPYSRMVAGIYSTKPGLTGRRQKDVPANWREEEVPMAMMGIVPTKVSDENGAIEPGDLLVSSSTPGYAMKGTDEHRLTGSVIGKAMGHLESGKGVIEVLVSLQ